SHYYLNSPAKPTAQDYQQLSVPDSPPLPTAERSQQSTITNSRAFPTAHHYQQQSVPNSPPLPTAELSQQPSLTCVNHNKHHLCLLMDIADTLGPLLGSNDVFDLAIDQLDWGVWRGRPVRYIS
ncbi:hypothetical protein BgiBS90_004491, partial [Biomphalaria glabrata]